MAGGVRHTAFQFSRFSRRQTQVLTWWLPESGVSEADGVIADGAIRSGKTVSMALAFVQWSMSSFNGQNFALCGKTVGSFRRNVLSVLRQILPGRGYQLSERRSENLAVITRGEVENYYYLFGGKDEASQDLIQGITLAGVLLDEAALMPRSFVEQATGRCSVDGSKFWFNCNPEGPEHWFKKEWIDKRAQKNLLYLHFTQDDNFSLSGKVKARYRAMYSGIFFKRYVLGEWCMAEGLVYQFDPERSVVDAVPSRGRYYISVDYGTLNPFSAGLWCVSEGRAVRIREYYYSGRGSSVLKTDEEYYAELERLAGGLDVECVVVDPSAASFITTIRRHGRFSVRKAKNDVLSGIRLTAALLQAGRLLFHRDCADSLREFGLYAWDARGEVDRPLKVNDHAMDDIRYFCSTVLRRQLRSIPELRGLTDDV